MFFKFFFVRFGFSSEEFVITIGNFNHFIQTFTDCLGLNQFQTVTHSGLAFGKAVNCAFQVFGGLKAFPLSNISIAESNIGLFALSFYGNGFFTGIDCVIIILLCHTLRCGFEFLLYIRICFQNSERNKTGKSQNDCCDRDDYDNYRFLGSGFGNHDFRCLGTEIIVFVIFKHVHRNNP